MSFLHLLPAFFCHLRLVDALIFGCERIEKRRNTLQNCNYLCLSDSVLSNHSQARNNEIQMHSNSKPTAGQCGKKRRDCQRNENCIWKTHVFHFAVDERCLCFHDATKLKCRKYFVFRWIVFQYFSGQIDFLKNKWKLKRFSETIHSESKHKQFEPRWARNNNGAKISVNNYDAAIVVMISKDIACIEWNLLIAFTRINQWNLKRFVTHFSSKRFRWKKKVADSILCPVKMAHEKLSGRARQTISHVIKTLKRCCEYDILSFFSFRLCILPSLRFFSIRHFFQRIFFCLLFQCVHAFFRRSRFFLFLPRNEWKKDVWNISYWVYRNVFYSKIFKSIYIQSFGIEMNIEKGDICVSFSTTSIKKLKKVQHSSNRSSRHFDESKQENNTLYFVDVQKWSSFQPQHDIAYVLTLSAHNSPIKIKIQ